MNLGDAKRFVSLLSLSDCIPLSRKAMYWEWSDNAQNIIGRSTMSRNKFDSMMQNFHLENNDRFDVTKKFAKMRELIALINEACANNYLPEQTVSMDESMISYFERPGAKETIYNKPIKFECKIWVAATCQGHCIQFNPYLGVGTVLDPDLGLGGSFNTLCRLLHCYCRVSIKFLVLSQLKFYS